MRRLISILAITALLFSSSGHAQTLAERGTLLDSLAGGWVMTGVIAGGEVVHDVRAEWVLGGHYLYLHELARERDAEGHPAYEARIYFGWDEAGERLVCLWLDITGGGGLVPEGFGYGVVTGDRIPFVWGEGEESQIHNTFSYLEATDQWAWHIDNVRQGEPSNFARVLLTRTAVAGQAGITEVDRGILDSIARLSSATTPGGGGAEAYASVLTEDFSRWTLNSEGTQGREALIEGIRQWLEDGWRVVNRESRMLDSTMMGDRAYTHRVVTEIYRGPDGKVSEPATFALEESWQEVHGTWLLRQVMVYPVGD